MTNTGKSESMVERVARSIYEKRNGVGCRPWSIITMAHKAPYIDDASAAIDASGVDDLIRTAFAFVEELRRMGYGETSERALPGSFDAMVLALERLR